MSLLLKIGFITLAYQLLKSEKASRGIGIWKEELKLSADGVIDPKKFAKTDVRELTA